MLRCNEWAVEHDEEMIVLGFQQRREPLEEGVGVGLRADDVPTD
jgi:hypothetical protein